MREIPKPLQVYRHFKGNLYQIVEIAEHTETGEKLVIYRSLTEPDKVYARELSMFMSEVDRDKYKYADQKYRFSLVSENEDKMNAVLPGDNTKTEGKTDDEQSSDSVKRMDEEKTRDEEGEYEGVIDRDLERFLDADSIEEKIDCYLLLRKKITPEMMQTVAISLDISLSEEELPLQYEEVLSCLKTKRKYESDRLH
ncbi:MAG: DUF1653 domain-containing protein [Lachnospiraceae bacterium]|nr:DUF1653 domain-containing protein [Lachnospiraceae bacterium]